MSKGAEDVENNIREEILKEASNRLPQMVS